MPLSRADMYIYQGDDYSGLVTVYSTDPNMPPDQVLAGFTAQAQIREDIADNTDDADAIAINTDVFSPYISLEIPNSVTENMCGQYVWDLQVTAPNGDIITLIRGNVLVTQEVTR